MAIAEGKVSLSLRNDVDVAVADTHGVSARDVVGGSPAATARAPRRAGPAEATEAKAAPAPAAPTHQVEVYRGARAETRSFETTEAIP